MVKIVTSQGSYPVRLGEAAGLQPGARGLWPSGGFDFE